MKMTKKELKQMLKLALIEIESLKDELSQVVEDLQEKQWIINEFHKQSQEKIKKAKYE